MITLSQNNGYLGIDIGTYAVKLAQIAKRGSRFSLIRSVVIPRQQPWDIQQNSPATSSTEEILAGITLQEGFKGKSSASTMSMVLCDSRTLTVPQGTSVEIETAIRIALGGVDRFQSNERTFDYWSVGEKPGGMEVNVLSTSTQWAEQLAMDHVGAGLRPQCIDGLPHSLARACQLMHSDSQPVIALDWGFSRSTFCLVQQGKPLFVRMLRGCGYERIMSGIAEEFVIPLGDAQSVLGETGLPIKNSNKHPACSNNDANQRTSEQQMRYELQTAVSGAIQSRLNEFAEELRRTISYVEQQQTLPQPVQIVLSGGGATLANVTPWLEKTIGLKTETWKMPQLDAQPDAVELLGPAIAVSALALQKGGGR